MKHIFTDRHRAADFRTAIAETCEQCNELIRLFNTFQPFEQIKSEAEFTRLCTDPQSYFDDILIAQVSPSILGKQQRLNPEPIANMLSIDRANFLNMVAGIPIRDRDCEPCRKAKIKPGQRAIHLNTYRHYQNYLTFDGGEFEINTPAVDEAVRKFDVYASTPEEEAVITHFDQLCELLNRQAQKYHITNPGREVIAKELHLYLSQGISGDFMPNKEYIKNQILSMR